MTTGLLDEITGPDRLRSLVPDVLPALADEIREFLVDRVCRTGGHLGPNLGVVELTIALHRVFESPADRIVFDTGHQAYVHKALTGRQDDFDGLRAHGGMSGYPSRAESDHDIVESSHASSSLSWADGLAKAQRLRAQDRWVVAVIGDGALTGGMAWEAMNNLGGRSDRVVVVLNDNGRSYDPTVGGLAVHLAALREGAHDGPTVFENLGFTYLGPVDGHDVAATERVLRDARACTDGPVLVHCVTEKGRGYPHAENDEADRMHGIGVLDPVTGRAPAAGARSWTEVFGSELAGIGADRPEVVALTAAMLRSVGLHEFAERFPDRVFDTGIAEQHTVTSAAGLARGGLHPVVCLYATFLNRAVDQVMMDVAMHRQAVTFVLDRAGITGPDGASHHGMWDLALLSAVPGMRIASPRDATQLAALLHEAVAVTDGPTVLRFPKAAAGPEIPAHARMDGIDVLHRSSSLPLDVLIVSTGALAGPATGAAELLADRGIGATVVDPRWLLPVNPTLVHMASRHGLVVTMEDGVRTGGVGSALATACASAGVATPVHAAGLPDAFLDHGGRGQILIEAGLSAEAVADTASDRLGGPVGGTAPVPAMPPVPEGAVR